MKIGEPGPGGGIAWIDLGRPLEERARLQNSVLRLAFVLNQTLSQPGPGFDRSRGAMPGAGLFPLQQLDLEGADDVSCDLILNRENIAMGYVVAVGPDLHS